MNDSEKARQIVEYARYIATLAKDLKMCDDSFEDVVIHSDLIAQAALMWLYRGSYKSLSDLWSASGPPPSSSGAA